MRALLLENVHPLASKILGDAGVEVGTLPSALDEDELIGALDGVDLLGIRSKTDVTRRFEAALSRGLRPTRAPVADQLAQASHTSRWQETPCLVPCPPSVMCDRSPRPDVLHL